MAALRMKYVRWLQKYIGVHIYGDCGTHKCGKVNLEIVHISRTITNLHLTQPFLNLSTASKHEPRGLLHTARPLL